MNSSDAFVGDTIPSVRAGELRKSRKRVAFLNSHPTQYYAPFYAYLTSTTEIEAIGLYLSDFSLRGAIDPQFGQTVKWDIDLLKGYESHYLSVDYETVEPYGFFRLRVAEAKEKLSKLDLDAVVIFGHNFLAIHQVISAAKELQIPLMYRSDTHLGLRRSQLKNLIRNPIMFLFFKQFDAFLAVGSENRRYYEKFGVPSRKIFDTPFSVDNSRFADTSKLSSAERKAVRRKLKVETEAPIILFASKFTTRKRPGDVLAACRILHSREIDFHLVYVGSGELQERLETEARNVPFKVTFAGFQNQTQLPPIFWASDVFVFPSENEPFGLVVNEAMAAGLPIIASSEIGCVPDLVHHDVNGRIFEAGDVEGLADALEPILRSEALRRKMSEKSREIVVRSDFASTANGLAAALASLP